jgi:acetylornithine deacetylase/succinyl-diaminopimelate desuccinylase-like protein
MTQQSTNLDVFKQYFKSHEQEILNDYKTFLSFKSISTDEEFIEETRQCANWLMDRIQEIGLKTELWETSGHPTIFAQNLSAGPDKPTLLIYNHYDVQPVDPLDLWKTPPFEPTMIDANIYARGAQDNKGQCMYVYQALKALINEQGCLPINIKWIIEGEEECGSEGLSGILSDKKEQLAADYIVVADVGIASIDKPSVTLGIRGIITMDVEITGSNTDLHSGTHGGRAYNPLHALAEVIAQLRDDDGRINVPGFYDDVDDLTDKEREQVDFSFDSKEYQQSFALEASGGEVKYAPLERSTVRPTLEVNGLSGGYSGTGFKTVIPAIAHAKISCRLVPHQDPKDTGNKVAQYIESLCPEGVSITVDVHEGGGGALRASPNSAVVKAFAEGYSIVFEKPCGFTFEGGSIPIVTDLANTCGGEVVLMGMGLDSDQIHAPNEHFAWGRFEKGFLVFTQTLNLL